MESESKNIYQSPFSSRYASKDMLKIFSSDEKFKTWRRLWVALAKAQHELGLNITLDQINQMQKHMDIIDYDLARKREKIVKHDVMAHIYAYSKVCPLAAKIIHLGATSCYITDNTDIILIKKALELIEKKILQLLKLLADFAVKYKTVPCLSYTHLQPAQLTTVGKRAALWLYDFYMDFENISNITKNMKLLGCKGATGTQASFLKLFGGDINKVQQLEQKILKYMGFKEAIYISGQTYSRKIDYFISSALCALAQSATKFSSDIRILQSFKELQEPFESMQVGSSAMPYKKNPIKCERIAAIARYIIVNSLNPAFTAAAQCFERTLDDSANKRIVIPEIFLASDSILNILLNVCSGLVVNEQIIRKRVKEQLPYMATENIMMTAVKKGGDRQKLHEKIRIYSLKATEDIMQGKKNSLIDMLVEDCEFKLNRKDIDSILKPENFIGLSPQQVDSFIKDVINPIFEKNKNLVVENTELLV